jgi:hypothetical protein
MDWIQFLPLLLGGSIVSVISALITMKATRKKAYAEAKGNELDNVQEAVKIWRELAESFKTDLDKARTDSGEVTRQLETLRNEVIKLTKVTTKVLKLLDKITPENLESTIIEIRDEIHNRNS